VDSGGRGKKGRRIERALCSGKGGREGEIEGVTSYGGRMNLDIEEEGVGEESWRTKWLNSKEKGGGRGIERVA